MTDLQKITKTWVADAIMHGMPVTEEIADVRNQIMGYGDQKAKVSNER